MISSAIIFSLTVFSIQSCYAITTNCRCLPGELGPMGQQGPEGLKGEKGDMGELGIEGPQGIRGPQGIKGEIGNPGPRGDDAPYLGYYYPGLPGAPGPQGRCECRDYNKNQEAIGTLQPGEYFYTDEEGNLNYLYKQFLQQFLQQQQQQKEKTTTSTTTTTTTPKPPITTEENNNESFLNFNKNKFISGLYIMGTDGVLVPFKQAQIYDLFAKITKMKPKPRTTTTTTTTTTTPAPIKNEKIYMLGPKGSLIPFHKWGFKNPFDMSGTSLKTTRRYSKWQRLRALLMGETLPDYDEEISAKYNNYNYDGEDENGEEEESK